MYHRRKFQPPGLRYIIPLCYTGCHRPHHSLPPNSDICICNALIHYSFRAVFVTPPTRALTLPDIINEQIRIKMTCTIYLYCPIVLQSYKYDNVIAIYLTLETEYFVLIIGDRFGISNWVGELRFSLVKEVHRKVIYCF